MCMAVMVAVSKGGRGGARRGGEEEENTRKERKVQVKIAQ